MGHLVPSPWASEPRDGTECRWCATALETPILHGCLSSLFCPHHHKPTIDVPTTTGANKRLPISLLIGVGNRTSPTTRSKAFIIEEQLDARLRGQKDSNNPH